MWPWSKKATQSPQSELRETFFGDMALTALAGANPAFGQASVLLQRNDRAAAIDVLRSILSRSGLESRHYLQAWHQLRQLGVNPPTGVDKHVFGVVVDVPMQRSFDTLVAYEDHRARYINYSGAVVIWEAPDSRLNALIDGLIVEGTRLAQMIGTWDGPRPPLASGQARISLLTPSGLHFGQGPPNLLAQDKMAAPLLSAATSLMQALTKLPGETRTTV